MPKQKLSGRASAARALRDTTECACGSTKPATITRMEWVSSWGDQAFRAVGYCVDCYVPREDDLPRR